MSAHKINIVIFDESLENQERFTDVHFSKNQDYYLHFCTSLKQVLSVYKKSNVDLIYFISKSLTEERIKELVYLKNLYVQTNICLIATNTYALPAWKWDLFHFLDLPIKASDLQFVFDKNLISKNAIEEQVLRIKRSDGIIQIPMRHLNYLKASGNYTIIVARDNKKEIQTKKLKEYEFLNESTPSLRRIHRSVMINFKNIISVKNNEILFKDLETKLSVSASLASKIKRILLQS